MGTRPTIQRETWAEAGPTALALTDAYWDEMRGAQEAKRLTVNPEVYAGYDAQERLVLITARTPQALVGFALFLALVHHQQGVLCGFADAWYLDPLFRQGLTGLMLLRKAESALRTLGCQHMYVSTSYRRNVTPVLRRLHFEPIGMMYCKALEG